LLSGASSENFCHLTIRFILFLLLVFSTDFDACLFEIALSTIAYKVREIENNAHKKQDQLIKIFIVDK